MHDFFDKVTTLLTHVYGEHIPTQEEFIKLMDSLIGKNFTKENIEKFNMSLNELKEILTGKPVPKLGP